MNVVDLVRIAQYIPDNSQTILTLLNTNGRGTDRTGLLLPIPTYPLYTACVAEYGMYHVRQE